MTNLLRLPRTVGHLEAPHVAQTMIRNNITPTAALATIQAICTAAGGDPSRLNLSYDSAYR